jgi:hypothetical protein
MFVCILKKMSHMISFFAQRIFSKTIALITNVFSFFEKLNFMFSTHIPYIWEVNRVVRFTF